MLGNFKPQRRFPFRSFTQHKHGYAELASFNGRYQKVNFSFFFFQYKCNVYFQQMWESIGYKQLYCNRIQRILVLSHSERHGQADGQTDRQTDRQTESNSGEEGF